MATKMGELGNTVIILVQECLIKPTVRDVLSVNVVISGA